MLAAVARPLAVRREPDYFRDKRIPRTDGVVDPEYSHSFSYPVDSDPALAEQASAAEK